MPVYLSRNNILFDSFKDIQQSARRLWEARRICFEKRYCLLCLLTSFSLEHTLITCSCVACTHHAVTFKCLFFFTWLGDVSSHLSVHSISPCFPVRRFCCHHSALVAILRVCRMQKGFNFWIRHTNSSLILAVFVLSNSGILLTSFFWFCFRASPLQQARMETDIRREN